MDTATIEAPSSRIDLPLLFDVPGVGWAFKEPNLGCYCPTCRTWYDCASSAHAGH